MGMCLPQMTRWAAQSRYKRDERMPQVSNSANAGREELSCLGKIRRPKMIPRACKTSCELQSRYLKRRRRGVIRLNSLEQRGPIGWLAVSRSLSRQTLQEFVIVAKVYAGDFVRFRSTHLPGAYVGRRRSPGQKGGDCYLLICGVGWTSMNAFKVNPTPSRDFEVSDGTKDMVKVYRTS